MQVFDGRFNTSTFQEAEKYSFAVFILGAYRCGKSILSDIAAGGRSVLKSYELSIPWFLPLCPMWITQEGYEEQSQKCNSQSIREEDFTCPVVCIWL